MTNANDLTFTEWLLAEMDKRGWSQADLADRAGNISRAAISLVITEARKPGPEVCRGIAKAFDLPEELVFRRARLLSAKVQDSERLEQIMHLATQLDPPEQALIIDELHMLLDRQAKRDVLKETIQRVKGMSDAEKTKFIQRLTVELGIEPTDNKRRRL